MELYQKAGLYEHDAVITSVSKAGKEVWVSFNKTIFYPGGGGQPHDIGTVTAKGFSAKVKEVEQKGDEILHLLKVKSGTPEKGMKVTLHVDKDRRETLARMHTAEHILFRAIQLTLEKKKLPMSLSKIALGTEQSSVFVNCPSLEWQDIFEAEKLANDVVSRNLEIVHHEVPKEKLETFTKKHELRIKVERIKGKSVRIVEIKGFDFSACTGIHAHSASEVGTILVTGLNKARGGYEIAFVAGALPELLNAAQQLRLLASRLQVQLKDVQRRVEEMLVSHDELIQKVRQLSYEQAGNVETESIGKLTLMWAIVDSLEHKQLVERAHSLLKPKSLVCLLNRTEKNTQALLMASEDLVIDLAKILNNILTPLGGKGGGRGNVAMGGCPAARTDEVLPALRSQLAKMKGKKT